MSTKIRVLLIDAQAMFCDGLRAVIVRESDIAVVGAAGDVTHAVKLVLETVHDIIVLDAQLPQRGALDLIRAVVAQRPETAIIVLVASADGDMVRTCVQAGAQGCLLKSNRAAVLIDAIRSVAAGGAVVDPVLASLLLADYRRQANQDSHNPPDSLTPRDLDILRHLVSGAGNRAIAHELALSPQTIKNRLSEIYRKLGVETRTEAVALALRKGLVRLD